STAIRWKERRMADSQPSRRTIVWGMFAVMATLASGCQTMSPALVACPMPPSEQAAKIQKIVPLGTPREEAIKKLKQAGVLGAFGANKSIFYCDTWSQSEEERWHIHVSLLFDDQGELYEVRTDPKPGAGPSVETAEAGRVSKPAKQIASGSKSNVVDPFAE